MLLSIKLVTFFAVFLPVTGLRDTFRLSLPAPVRRPVRSVSSDGDNPQSPRIVLSTPQFAANASSVELKWIIGVPIGYCIEFTLQRLAINNEVACFSGYLGVYDGRNADSANLMRLCGSPSTIPSPVVTTGSAMFVTFINQNPGDSSQFVQQGFLGYAVATACQTPAPTTATSTAASTSTKTTVSTIKTTSSSSATATTKPTSTSGFGEYDLGDATGAPVPTVSSVDGVVVANMSNNSVCGYSLFGPKPGLLSIVGGTVAEAHAWPWQASLRYRGMHTCGGSLISQRHVVTAGHCFAISTAPPLFQLYFGRTTRDETESTEQKLDIDAIFVHPDYKNNGKYDSDIAVVRLKEPGVTFNSYVSPICLPRIPPPPGKMCYVTGYGTTMNTGGDGMLKQAPVPIIANDECASMSTKIAPMLNDKMVCAGYSAGGIDSCAGDSGGPLACQLGQFPHFWSLSGLVSFGFSCAQPDLPGVYTRVGKFEGWIRSIAFDLQPY